MSCKIVVTESDIEELQELLRGVVGEECWRAYFTYGKELSLNLGPLITVPSQSVKPMEWPAWVFGSRGTAWRLTRSNQVMLTSGDDLEIASRVIAIVEQTHVTGCQVRYPTLGLEIGFDNGVQLEIIPRWEDNQYAVAYWEMFTPNGMLIAVGPGNKWCYR